MIENDGETDIALIKNDISYIKGDLIDIKASLRGLPTLFASKDQLSNVAVETEKRLCSLENSVQGTKRFIIPILAAISSSIVTFLVIEYIKKV